MTSSTIIKRLDKLRPEIRNRYGIEVLGVVGSVARGEAKPDSDIDIAYRIIKGRKVSLFHLGGAWDFLNTAFDKDIDLVDWDALRPNYKNIMEPDLVRFYG